MDSCSAATTSASISMVIITELEYQKLLFTRNVSEAVRESNLSCLVIMGFKDTVERSDNTLILVEYSFRILAEMSWGEYEGTLWLPGMTVTTRRSSRNICLPDLKSITVLVKLL